MLHDALEVISRMLEPGKATHATHEGIHHRVAGARNVPKPIQASGMPIMVGGNGPNVTWRLAARHADELNLDGMSPADVVEALPVIRARCEEIGRDPATLSVSVHIWKSDAATAGARRVDLLAGYREQGVSRVMALVEASTTSDEALEALRADAEQAGLDLAARA